ncbi:hypothetical protein [Vibrio diabolicus]
MDTFSSFLNTHVQWVFSGVGVAFISLIGRFIYKKFFSKESDQTGPSQTINAGDNSINIQALRDANVDLNKGDANVRKKD